MFEKESKEYANKWLCHVKDLELYHKKDDKPEYIRILEAYQKGAEFGYNKANEWHRVSDKLPAMDVFVYLWKKGDDFPIVACRHIFHGHKEWVWYCMWGSGFTISQLKGRYRLWKEIVLPEG